MKTKHRLEYQYISPHNPHLTLNDFNVRYKINACIAFELLI